MSELAALFRLGDPLELIVRGSAIYWFLFLLFRFVLRRDAGSLGMADVLLVVLIADAAQNAMSGQYESISDGFILIATIAGWNVLINALHFSFPSLRRLFEAAPLLLIRDGRMLRKNMRRELVTEDELLSKLRQNGIADLAGVRLAYMESDGEISVIRSTAVEDAQAPQPPAGGKR